MAKVTANFFPNHYINLESLSVSMTMQSKNSKSPDRALLLHLIIESDKPIVLFGPKLSHASKGFLNITGLKSPHAISHFTLYRQNDKKEDITTLILTSAKNNGQWQGPIRFLLHEKDNIYIDTDIIVHLFHHEDKKNDEVLVLVEFQMMESNQSLNMNHLAQLDPITGLPNNYLFQDRVGQAIISAPQQGKTVSIFIIKLGKIKMYAGAYGVKIAHQLLKEITQRLQSCIRLSDTIARIGEEQFAVVSQISSSNDSVLIAKKIITAFKPEFVILSQQMTVSPRIGISSWPIDGRSTNELIAVAGTALHQTKKITGGAYTFYSQEFNARAKHRLELEKNLKKALQQNNFTLYYQPKVRTCDHKIVGAEALIRWIDPEKGMIPPSEFIPIAEETGLICEIGDWVLSEGIRQCDDWFSKDQTPIKLSLNVSARQLGEAGFVQRVRDELDKYPLPPEYLELEITESLIMSNIDEAIKQLNAIRALGCKIAIDDFGTGYSSLSYLTRIPLDTVKIDRSFIFNLNQDASINKVTKGIISLSKSLKLEVVAEGAETLAQIDFLEANQCDLIQGYYFSKPVPAKAFQKLMQTGHFNTQSITAIQQGHKP